MRFLDLFRKRRVPSKQVEISSVHLHNTNPNLAVVIQVPGSAPQLLPPMTSGMQKLEHFLGDDGQLHITIAEVVPSEDTLDKQVQLLRTNSREQTQLAGELAKQQREGILRLPKSVKE